MRKKYTEDEISGKLIEYTQSKLGKNVFARQEKISVNTLNKWIKASSEKCKIEEYPKFISIIQVENQADNPQNKANVVTIKIKEYEILVSENSSENLILKALQAVKSVC